MVRRSSLYAWQLQYGLSTDTSIGSVPTESEASVSGNTGGNAGGSNPSPPARGGGLSSLSAQSTLDEVVEAFEGISDPTTVSRSLGVGANNNPVNQRKSVLIPSTAVRRMGDSNLTRALRTAFGSALVGVDLYSDGNGRNWILLLLDNSGRQASMSISPEWYIRSGDPRYIWRYVP